MYIRFDRATGLHVRRRDVKVRFARVVVASREADVAFEGKTHGPEVDAHHAVVALVGTVDARDALHARNAPRDACEIRHERPHDVAPDRDADAVSETH